MGNKEMVEELNSDFALVFMVENTRSLPELQESQVRDGRRPRILKEIAEKIVEALVVIFRASLESGLVPENWKMANVIPLFKKGGRQKIGNYRPISLTSVIGKILEFIIKDEILEYLELLEFFEELLSYLDKGEPLDITYLDFQKAFNK
eukprot:g39994.t1